MKVSSLLEYGRKRANILAQAENNIRLPESDLTDDTVGRDYLSAAVAAARTVASVVVDGTTYALVSSLADLDDNLKTFIRRFEADPTFITASYSGGTLVVEHFGAAVVDKLIFDDDSEFDMARTTTVNISRKFTFTVEADGDADLVVGSDTEAIDVPAAVTAGANETALKDAIDAGSYTLLETTEVVANTTANPAVFEVAIYVNIDDGVPTFGGDQLTYEKRDIEEVFS